jgi:hypothetical protein
LVRHRSIVAGGTDYTGVALSDIVAHLRDWHSALLEDAEVLGNVRRRLSHFDGAKDPRVHNGIDEIDHFVDLFHRYAGDLARLADELPLGVFARHVVTVRQLYQSSRVEETYCVRFKQDYRLDGLNPHDEVQNVLAEIYRVSRDAVINLRDLSNVISRLEALVSAEPAPSPSPQNALELKPNVFGIGLNFNFILDRWGIRALSRWWKRLRGETI